MKKHVWELGVGLVIGSAAAKIIMNSKHEAKLQDQKKMSEKHFRMFLLMNQWVENKQKGFSMVQYFNQRNMKTIAIYGMSYIGQRLYDELKGSDIEIKYAIDQNTKGVYSEIDVYSSLDNLPEVDAIVVTAFYHYVDIEKELQSKTDNLMISLEDIIYKLS